MAPRSHLAERTAPSSGPTVLVVDDSDVIRRVLSLILEGEGYRVVECPTGSAAPDLARASHPDVITLDLDLPDGDGRDVLRRIRRDGELGDVPVVIVSAYADELSSAERSDVTDVIAKPFDVDDLLDRLDRALQPQPDEGCGEQTTRRGL